MNHTKVQQILENTSHLDLYIHAIDGPVLYISVLCIGVAWGVGFYWKQFKFLHRLFYFFAPIVTCNLGFDWLYARVVVYRYLSLSLWCTRVLEHACIDRTVEHHLAHGAQNLSRQSSRKQTGLLNHYIMLTCVVIAIMGGAIFFLI
jgi:NADH:ubiquinone oxidoreductase subunit 5 (subunit L)/multisubunit Na+/H+ antiporter MnhA subunit